MKIRGGIQRQVGETKTKGRRRQRTHGPRRVRVCRSQINTRIPITVRVSTFQPQKPDRSVATRHRKRAAAQIHILPGELQQAGHARRARALIHSYEIARHVHRPGIHDVGRPNNELIVAIHLARIVETAGHQMQAAGGLRVKPETVVAAHQTVVGVIDGIPSFEIGVGQTRDDIPVYGERVVVDEIGRVNHGRISARGPGIIHDGVVFIQRVRAQRRARQQQAQQRAPPRPLHQPAQKSCVKIRVCHTAHWMVTV